MYRAIVEDCQPVLALTKAAVIETLCLDKQSPELAALDWIATDQLPGASHADFAPYKCAADDLAFLQYTSGSTSDPRGVMVSHRNVLHNLEVIRTGFDLPKAGQGERTPQGVFWLPAYHDMGLIGGILTPIFVAGTSHLLSPATFLRKPQRWLQRLSQTGAEISGAPNFGYELAVEKTTPDERAELDLGRWRLAFCGAEPIRAETLTRFAGTFRESGFRTDAFYPCYGMAEVTLLVTGGRGPASPRVVHVDRQKLAGHQVRCIDSAHQRALPLVGCGDSLQGQTIEIVDPKSRTACPDDRVGEIWVCGDSVATGYWNRSALNQEVFAAALASNGEQRYLRTGDLGFRRGGDLFVTGRLKDVIIIRGRNHYPQDIELTAQRAHVATDLGAAFSVPGAGEEQLVLVIQLKREHRRSNSDEVLRSVRAAIVDEHELDPNNLVLIRPVSLPVTSSGKVQRQRCRELFLAGQLDAVGQWEAAAQRDLEGDAHGSKSEAPPTFLYQLSQFDQARLAQEVRDWLIGWLTVRANLQPGAVRPDTPFAELGIDSLSAVEISQEIDQIWK